MNGEVCCRLNGVRKRHDASFMLEVEDLQIATGEMLCLLGPTGAGKSTLLRLLSALEQSSVGEVKIFDHRLDQGPLPLSRQRKIAMVFQRPQLLSGTVRANIEYGLRVRGERADLADRVDAVLRRLNLQPLADQAATKLSGGQAQLVALARALVVEPELLLLDEPTSQLDPAHVALVEQAVADERKSPERTIVWATHNLFQARRISERVAFLLNGELIEVSASDNFFESPSDPRTAEFVEGKMIY
jgi:tungstate transport system ATP-binding protein